MLKSPDFITLTWNEGLSPSRRIPHPMAVDWSGVDINLPELVDGSREYRIHSYSNVVLITTMEIGVFFYLSSSLFLQPVVFPEERLCCRVACLTTRLPVRRSAAGVFGRGNCQLAVTSRMTSLLQTVDCVLRTFPDILIH